MSTSDDPADWPWSEPQPGAPLRAGSTRASLNPAQLRMLGWVDRYGRVPLVGAACVVIGIVSVVITWVCIMVLFGTGAWVWRYAVIPLVCVTASAPWGLLYVLELLEGVAELSEEHRRAAEEDQLTGLLNRRGLFDRARHLPPGSSVLLADVDDFKAVNDSRGHEEGDRALVAVARALQALVGHRALVARTGGDEFVAVLDPTQPVPDLTRLAVPVPSGVVAHVSLGWVRHERGGLDASLALADLEMYRVKEGLHAAQ